MLVVNAWYSRLYVRSKCIIVGFGNDGEEFEKMLLAINFPNYNPHFHTWLRRDYASTRANQGFIAL